jgi:arginase family enzyme
MKIVKVKSSSGCLGKNIGCEKAPDEIVKCFDEVWSNENGKSLMYDVSEVEDSNIEELNKKLEKTKGDIFIGGDHSITYASFKGFAKEFKNPGLIVFDAHPDCFETEGFDIPTHEDYLMYLIKEGILKARNVILLGIRNADSVELKFISANKIKVYNMKDLDLEREEICDGIMEQARSWDGLYLSLDIDVLDPAFAPGTGYLEPGGMSTRDLLYFIQRIKLLKNLKRVDLVEVNPLKDKDTCKVAAKLLAEFL